MKKWFNLGYDDVIIFKETGEQVVIQGSIGDVYVVIDYGAQDKKPSLITKQEVKKNWKIK